jgi:hypothetical protein
MYAESPAAIAIQRRSKRQLLTSYDASNGDGRRQRRLRPNGSCSSSGRRTNISVNSGCGVHVCLHLVCLRRRESPADSPVDSRTGGYQVTSALGFTQAKVQSRGGRFDLMVLGHSLPCSDKTALIEFFRSHYSAPILCLLRAGEATVEGADHYVSPDNPKRLIVEIANILGETQRSVSA